MVLHYGMPFVAKLFTAMGDSYFKNQFGFFFSELTRFFFQWTELVFALLNKVHVHSHNAFLKKETWFYPLEATKSKLNKCGVS